MHPMGVHRVHPHPRAWRVHTRLAPDPFLPPGGVGPPRSSVMYPHPTCTHPRARASNLPPRVPQVQLRTLISIYVIRMNTTRTPKILVSYSDSFFLETFLSPFRRRPFPNCVLFWSSSTALNDLGRDDDEMVTETFQKWKNQWLLNYTGVSVKLSIFIYF